MKNLLSTRLQSLPGGVRSLFTFGLLVAVCTEPFAFLQADDAARIFATPPQAVAALSAAVNGTNQTAFEIVFGAAARDLENADPVQGAREMAEFAYALNATNRLVHDSSDRLTLEVGTNFWPFPVPLMKVAGGWQFNAAAGLDEIQNRRVGRNEMDVLRVLRAYVQAQREYASRDRDGDEVLEYAQKLASSPGLTDGLFWQPEVNGGTSPLGPLVAYAQAEGYTGKKTSGEEEPRPFHGYLFKILTRQGKHAAGGKYDYVINGNMIGGFAMVAWPAEYGESGIMTFLVSQQGRVYQRDLGTKTARIVAKMVTYDPDANWRPSAD